MLRVTFWPELTGEGATVIVGATSAGLNVTLTDFEKTLARFASVVSSSKFHAPTFGTAPVDEKGREELLQLNDVPSLLYFVAPGASFSH
jgi:hypothetical protein